MINVGTVSCLIAISFFFPSIFLPLADRLKCYPNLVTAGEDQSYTAASLLLGSLHSAALAAELLENACSSGSEDDLRREVIRELARDLKGELEVLAARAEEATSAAGVEVIEGALRAADVANLAASALPELSRTRTLEAAAATHLAAGAARALSALARTTVKDPPDAEHACNALKDVRGAAWRARLASGQVDELLEEIG
jgi:hypothetical protein